LAACGLSYAAGAGLRPSDGAFLGPLFLFFTVKYVSDWPRRLTLLAISCVGCLAWFIPTQIAAHAAHAVNFGSQMSFAQEASPLKVGINQKSIANTLRVVLPLLAAFWMFVPAVRFQRSLDENRIILLWITPGLLFMLLVYMADPVYFTFFTAAIILMVALSRQQRIAFNLLLACAIFNVILFFFAAPIKGSSRLDQALNFYVIKYSFYGVRHNWSSTIGRGAIVP
jgi:hypothetical protein